MLLRPTTGMFLQKLYFTKVKFFVNGAHTNDIMTTRFFCEFIYYVSFNNKHIFRCKICGRVLLFTHDPLKKHLLTSHMMSIHEYRKTYLSTVSTDEIDDKMNTLTDASLEGMSYLTTTADNGNDEDCVDEPVELTDDLSDLGLDLCGMCGLPQKYLRNHVSRVHGKSMAQYRQLHPTDLCDSKLFHR